jgi:hypothetical protein
MVNGSPIYFYKTKSLSNLRPSSLVAVKADGDPYFELYVVDKTGIPYPIKDETGGTGGSGITNITSTGGTITITGSGGTRNVEINSSILTTINSALQSGNNVSLLLNDAGYITLADIPPFDPTDYDLDDFNNTSADPFARQSELPTGGATNLAYTPSPTNGVVTSDTGTDATIPLANGTNAGLLSPTEKSEIASAVQPSDLGAVATSNDYNDLDNLPTIPSAYTDEQAQDAVGNILTDSTEIDFQYNDGTPSISANLRNNSIANARLEHITANHVKGRLSGNGVVQDIAIADLPISTATQTALDLKANKANVEQVIRSKANGTFGSHTGDTLETVLLAIDIDANEFVAGDRLIYKIFTDKSAAVGNVQFRVRVGTTGTTSDSLIATSANFTGNNSRYMLFDRERNFFLSGNSFRCPSASVASATDISAMNGVPTTVSLNPSNAWKFVITAQLSAGSETTNLVGYTISKIKSL